METKRVKTKTFFFGRKRKRRQKRKRGLSARAPALPSLLSSCCSPRTLTVRKPEKQNKGGKGLFSHSLIFFFFSSEDRIENEMKQNTRNSLYSSSSSASSEAMLKYLSSYTLRSLLDAITRSQSRTLCFLRNFFVRYLR